MCRRKKNKIHQLSEDTFKAFEPYINIFGCGQKVYIPKSDQLEPRPLITKETRSLYWRYKAGERNLFYQHGDPFQPWHFVNGIFAAQHVEQQIYGQAVFFYTSGQERFAIGYLDLDAHCRFQTDAPAAKDLVTKAVGDGYAFWRDSNRGLNGYLKLAHEGQVDECNALLARLQTALGHYLRSQQILTDFEVKGGINTKEKNAHLAKLPFCTFAPCIGRDSWNYTMLRQFEECPILPLSYLTRLVQQLEKEVDLPRAMAWDEHVRTLKLAEQAEAEKVISAFSRVDFAGVPCRVLFVQPERYVLRPLGPVPQCLAHKVYQVGDDCRIHVTAAELRSGLPDAAIPVALPTICPPATEAKPEPAQAVLHIPKINLANTDEPDSYKRQQNALLVYARRIKRLPTLAEALKFIQDNKLYTGAWPENDGRRKSRVRHILKHMAKTFDASKCNQGQVEVEKYRTWAKKAFPERIPLYTTSVDEFLNCHSYRRGYANHEDIAIYLAVFEFCLDQGQLLQDKGIPHGRIFGLWKKLYQAGKVKRSVNDLKIEVIRETLVSREVIQITDRNYSPVKHVSMKYEYGKFFPGKNLYREQKTSSCRIVLDPRNPKKFLILDCRVQREEKTPTDRCANSATLET